MFYFLIMLLTFFIFFPKLQDYFFQNGGNRLIDRFRLIQLFSSRKANSRRIRKKGNQDREK